MCIWHALLEVLAYPIWQERSWHLTSALTNPRTLQVEEAKDLEVEGVLQQMQRLKEDAAAQLHSASEREAALAADVR